MICIAPLVLWFAQDATPNAQRPPRGDAVDEPRRTDPFQPDDALRKALGIDRSKPRGDEFTPFDVAPELPQMRMRAYLKLAKRDTPAAMVDVVGVGTYTVHVGESLSFALAGRPLSRPVAAREADTSASVRSAGVVVREQVPVVLRIEKVAPDGVVVEVGTLGEFLIIR